MHLRRDRAEGLDRRRGRRDAAGERRPRVHDRGERGGVRPRVVPVPRPVRGRGAGRRTGCTTARPPLVVYDDLSKQADGVPHDLAPASPSAGPRGVSRRRLLPALAPAGARGEALRRARRRVADGPADRRDQGRRRLRVHPDERHLDHRRPDLPGARPVLLGRPPGHQRRHLGLARRRQRADQGDEEGRRPSAPRPGAVPRARGVRRSSAPSSTRPRRRSWRAAPGWWRSSSSPSTSRWPVEKQVVYRLRRHERRPRRRTRSRTRSASWSGSPSSSRRATPRSSSTIRRAGDLSDETTAALDAAIEAFAATFVPTDTGPRLRGRSRQDHPEGRGQAGHRLGPHVLGRGQEPPHAPTEEEAREEFESKAGPLGQTDFPG